MLALEYALRRRKPHLLAGVVAGLAGGLAASWIMKPAPPGALRRFVGDGGR